MLPPSKHYCSTDHLCTFDTTLLYNWYLLLFNKVHAVKINNYQRLGFKNEGYIKISVIFIEPSNPMPFFPYTNPYYAIGLNISTFPILFSISPLSLISSTVRPIIDSETMFFVINILTVVFSTIAPVVNSFPLHIVILPFSFILPPICPFIFSISVYFIVYPLPNIDALIRPLISSKSMFFSFNILPFIFWTILPSLYSIPILKVIPPVSLILRPI